MSTSTKKPFAKRSLGQNFLVDQNYIRKIIEAVDPREADTIIEIGPGRGAITERLVDSGANVIAIELDRDLVPLLRDQFRNTPNLQVVEADATKVDFVELSTDIPHSALRTPAFKLVANLPYYISTAILQHLGTQREIFSSLVLMFQKEVVDRITAKPGTSDRGFLTVLVESSFHVEKLFDVPPNAFRPVPKVTSTVARLTPKPQVIKDEPFFRGLISTAFAQKRKTILNNLKTRFPESAMALERSGIDASRRAESLSLEELLHLSENLKSN
jgi:16S rRNA (adenine1518-N6/adenine1519-N6)-dimethyltransferase